MVASVELNRKSRISVGKIIDWLTFWRNRVRQSFEDWGLRILNLHREGYTRPSKLTLNKKYPSHRKITQSFRFFPIKTAQQSKFYYIFLPLFLILYIVAPHIYTQRAINTKLQLVTLSMKIDFFTGSLFFVSRLFLGNLFIN